MSTAARRQALVGTLVALLGFHVFHAFFQGDGGWWDEHDGIVNAIWAFFELSFEDPVLSAGLSDFVVVAGIFAIFLVSEIPAERRWTTRTYVWIVPMVIFPGLGIILYFLWLNPEHRFMTGRDRAAVDA